MPRILTNPGPLLANLIAVILPTLLLFAAMYLAILGVPLPLLAVGGALGCAIPVWIGKTLLSPPKHWPTGPISDVGAHFGHAWIANSDGSVWVEDEHAEALREDLEAPKPTSSPSGFKLSLPPPSAPNFAIWLLWRTYLLGNIGLGLSTLTILVIHVSQRRIASDFTDSQAAIVFVAVMWFLMMGYGLFLAPSWLGTVLLQGTPSRTTKVSLHGHMLRAGPDSFTLSMPGQTLRLESGRQGNRLVLKNTNQELALRGPYAHLSWLKKQLESLPPLGDEDTIPDALRELTAARHSPIKA